MGILRRSPSAKARAERSPVTSRPLAMPHERDESTSIHTRDDARTAQAADDVASGKVDTDNYSRMRDVNARNPDARDDGKKRV